MMRDETECRVKHVPGLECILSAETYILNWFHGLTKDLKRDLPVLRSSTTNVERIETSSAGCHQLARLVGLSPEGRNLPAWWLFPPALQISFRLSNSRLTKEKNSPASTPPPFQLPSLPRFFFDDIQPSPPKSSQNGPPFSCLLQLYVLRPLSHAQLAYDTHTVVHGSRDGRPIAT